MAVGTIGAVGANLIRFPLESVFGDRIAPVEGMDAFGENT